MVTTHIALGQQEQPGHSVTLGIRAVKPLLIFDPMGDKMPTAVLARKISESKGNGSDPGG